MDVKAGDRLALIGRLIKERLGLNELLAGSCRCAWRLAQRADQNRGRAQDHAIACRVGAMDVDEGGVEFDRRNGDEAPRNPHRVSGRF